MPRISDLPLTTSVDEATALIAVSSNGTTYKITPANLLASSGVGVSFYDSDSSHLITLAGGSNLSANRTLTLTTGDSNRTLDISAGDTTISAFAITILDDANAAAVRSTLGLGSMALETATDYLTVASAVSGYQPLDADLTTLAASITAFGHSLVDDTNAAAARTTLGLGTAAVENIGTSGATLPFLNGTNTWSGINEFSTTTSGIANVLVTCVNDDAVAGPFVTVYRNSASPAVNDQLGTFSFDGKDSAGNYQNYALMRVLISSPTSGSESALFNFVTTQSGTFASRVRIGGGLYTTNATGGDLGAETINANTLYEAGTALTSKYGQLAASNSWTASQGIVGTGSFFVGLTITSTNADANAGPYLVLRRAGGSPAASDQVGNLTWQSQDSGLVDDNVANINVLVVDPTATSEDYQLRFQVMIAGSLGTRGYWGAGLVVGTPTGGDTGGGTINASTYYQNGTVFSSVYGVLAGSNSWSNTNTFSSSCTFTTSSSFGIPATFISTNADANAGPYLYLYRNSASAVASDIGPTVSLRMNDSAGTAVNTSEFYATVTSVTPGAVSANLVFTTIQSGSAASRLTLGAGVYVGSVTGGDKGAGTLNATTLYEAGTSLAAKYAQVANNLSDLASASTARTNISALFGRTGGTNGVHAGQTTAALNNHTVILGAACGNAGMTSNNCVLIGAGGTVSPGAGITSGNFNNIIGQNCGGSISSGTTNVILGSSAGTSITTTSYNTLIGGLAGQYVTGQYNAAFGYSACKGQSGLTTGDGNMAFGNFALNAITTASNCTAVGASALTLLTTASGSTAVGVSALANITTGLGNSAIGNSAGFHLPTSAAQNTLIGDFALAGASGVTTNAASDNVVIGYNAAKGAGWTSGAKNTIIGSGAMSHATVTSASNNIAIGYNCANSVITTGTYNIFIGDAITPAAATQSNEINIGGVYRGTNTANGRANPYGAILGWTNSGDVAPAAGTGVTQLPAECFTIGSQVVLGTKTWYIYVNDAGTIKKLQIAVA